MLSCATQGGAISLRSLRRRCDIHLVQFVVTTGCTNRLLYLTSLGLFVLKSLVLPHFHCFLTLVDRYVIYKLYCTVSYLLIYCRVYVYCKLSFFLRYLTWKS